MQGRWWLLQAAKPAKWWTGTEYFPLHSKSHQVNICCKKGLTAKQAEYVYNNCRNEGKFGTEQVYECGCNDIQQTDSKQNFYECIMFNDFELYIAPAESAEIEQRSILSTKIN